MTYKKEFFKDKEVLITGGTGTLGKALLKELQHYPLKGLRILSRDEFKQWQMKSDLKTILEVTSFPTAFIVGDVREKDRLFQAFQGVHIVIHTAAMKQVPACEDNPWEAVKTNVQGTENVCRAAIECNVEQVMFISTDKAVYPINLYGATKAVAEKTVIRSNIYSPHSTNFNVCRYGNVLGSRGSVIELFKEQIETGKPLTVTDKRMTRFWITSTFMANFILKAVTLQSKGVIFIPHMKSAPILRLAEVEKRKSGGKSVEIKDIGIRRGEKIHEALVTEEELSNIIKGPFSFMILDQWEQVPENVNLFNLHDVPFTSNGDMNLTVDELEDMINE